MQFELNSVIKFVVLGMLLPSVQSEDAKTNSLECVKDFSDSTDYFPEKISIEDATLFQVEYKKYYKIVKNSSAKESIVLYQCGTKQPKVDSVTKYFEIPISKVTVKDTSAISYLSALGVEGTIKTVDSTSSISNACIQKSLKDKTITALSTTNTTLTKEQLSNNKITFTSFDDPKNPDPLSVIISATMDPSLKARAEWLEYYSLFYNLEGKAQKITGAINDNYNCLKKKADSLKEKNSIKVAWVSYVEYNEDKYFTLSGAPFKKNLISDAGAELITSKEEKVKDAASLLELIKDADVIVDESFTIDSFDDFLKAFSLTKDSKIKAITNKKVFRLDGIGSADKGYDWFESGVLMADAVLQDFIRAIYPENSLKGVKDHLWFRNIAENETKVVVTADDCKKKEWSNFAANCSTGEESDSSKDLSKGSNNKDKVTGSSAFVLNVFSAAGIAALAIPFLF